MKKIIFHVFVLALLAGMTSCGSKKDAEGSESDAFNGSQDRGDPTDSFEDIILNIPPPSEIPYLLLTTGADFNESIINPYSKVDQYLTTEAVKALNLGVYAADLGYLSSYDKTQDALNYMASMKKLADELGATTAYDMEMFGRFESNLGERDSLYKIIDQGILDADVILKSEDRGDIAVMLTVGSFTEGLYIATQLIAQYPKGIFTEEQKYTVLTPLIRVILEQENSLGDLIKLASSVPSSDRTDKLISELKSLQEQFEALDIDEKIADNRGEELLNDATLKNMIDQVAVLRNSITD